MFNVLPTPLMERRSESSMSNLEYSALLTRSPTSRYPHDPPKGKGGRVAEASGLVATAYAPQLAVVVAYRQLQFSASQLNMGSMLPSRYAPQSPDKTDVSWTRTLSQRMSRSSGMYGKA